MTPLEYECADCHHRFTTKEWWPSCPECGSKAVGSVTHPYRISSLTAQQQEVLLECAEKYDDVMKKLAGGVR